MGKGYILVQRSLVSYIRNIRGPGKVMIHGDGGKEEKEKAIPGHSLVEDQTRE